MKKTIALIMVLIGPLVSSAFSSTDKQDVTDPVLQEIIMAFNSRMPRFIDKHGSRLFVADEPVTRSALMMALYEYDKSARAMPAREYATRQEIADLRSRLAILERNVSSDTHVSPGAGDITQIINDLGPNMPILLDNSLNSSKVFTKFKNDVLARQAAASTASGPGGGETAGLAELTRRVERMEKASAAPVSMTTAEKSAETAELNRRLALVEGAMATLAASGKKDSVSAEITELTRRLERMEKASAATTSLSANEKSTEITDIQRRLALLDKSVGSLSASGKNLPSSSEISELTRRIERMEKASAAPALSAKNSFDESVFIDEIQKTRLQGKRDLARLEKRLDEVEKVSYSGEKIGGAKKQSSSLFTKVSFGLSILAAFYIAR